MSPRNGVTMESGAANLPATLPDGEQRSTSLGFGGERRGSQSEAWALRNRLRCASLAMMEATGATEGAARSGPSYRLVCSCDLQILDEAY
jgi:hypothetical protein